MRKMCSTQKIGLFLAALVFAGWIGLLVLYPAEGLPLPVFGMYLIFASGAVGCATLCVQHGLFGYQGEQDPRTLIEISLEEGPDAP